MNYFAIVHHEEGSAFGVSFPDVPDCFAAADEEKDVLRYAISALDDYFSEGQQAPRPRGHLEIMQEVAEDLAEGAWLISVPFIKRITKTVRANITLDQGLRDAADEAADLLGINRSAFIAQALRNEILRAEEAA
jgi:predicted RNase H-like HicB family nuclease